MHREGKTLHHIFKPMTNNELTLDQLRDVQGGIFLLLLAACKAKKANPEPTGGDIMTITSGKIVDGANENIIKEGGEAHCHPLYGNSSGNTQGQVKDDCENLPF